MKKKMLYLCVVLALCLCLCMMLVACSEQPAVEPPVTETPETSDELNTPNAPVIADTTTPTGEESNTDSGKKGQLHLTPGGDSADVNIKEPNEQLPDSTLRG
ncbi:MAG: hypothetical protein IJY22_05090 [Clostridia bacterium]|nr:hypothetical protein [Clostridia bacterium]